MANLNQSIFSDYTQYTIKNQSVLRMAEYYSKEFKPILAKVRKKWSVIVRDYLREETGLRLYERKNLTINNKYKDNNVEYVAKLDRSDVFLKALDKNYPDLDFDEFMANRQLKAALENARTYYSDNQNITHIQFNHLKKYLDHYFKKYDVEDILNTLYRNSNQAMDIWGTYHFMDSHIELYVIPLVLFTKLQPINLEFALLTTLVHEMAHAFHHVGRDRDGKAWPRMYSADLNIIEGLAEYYTWQFVEDFEKEYPEMKKTYMAMYNCLSGPYVIFQNWIKEKYSREHVKLALQAVRRNDIKGYQDFLDQMKQAKALIK